MTPEQQAKLIDQHVRIAIGNLVVELAAARAENETLRAVLPPPVVAPAPPDGAAEPVNQE